MWGNYAFVTADEGVDGLLIVDLTDLTGNTFLYTTIDNNNNIPFFISYLFKVIYLN